MRKYIVYLSPVVFILLILASCKKREGDNEKLDDEKNESVKEIMPTTFGSWWIYGSTEGNVVKRQATNKDSIKMGVLYNYYESVDTNTGYVTPEYYAKNELFYLRLLELDSTQTNYIPTIVFKDSALVGESWTNTGTVGFGIINVDVLIEGEVVEIIDKMTMSGFEFENVVKTTNKLKAKFGPTPWTDCGEIEMWFCKGVGIIKSHFDIQIPMMYNRTLTDSLLNYHIEAD